MIERRSSTHKIINIEERFQFRHVPGTGAGRTTDGQKEHVSNPQAVERYSIGWYITLDNYLCFHVGENKPNYQKGAVATLALEIPS